MSIAAVGAVSSFTPLTAPVVPSVGAAGAGGAAGTSGAGFAHALATGMDKLQAAQDGSDKLAAQAATGDLRDVHDYLIASTEASLQTELTVAVRNKAVEAFTEIMRMPV